MNECCNVTTYALESVLQKWQDYDMKFDEGLRLVSIANLFLLFFLFLSFFFFCSSVPLSLLKLLFMSGFFFMSVKPFDETFRFFPSLPLFSSSTHFHDLCVH